jgi:hypothetical protein
MTKIPKLFGVPRSGSTVMFNIINYLFDGAVAPQKHKYFEDDDGYVVATYRDFRDSCISQWRAFYGAFDEEKDKKPISQQMLSMHVFSQITTINFLDEFKRDQLHKNRNILFLRYETFFDSNIGDLDFEYIFETLEKFFDMKITSTQKAHIRNEYSFSSQKQKSRKFKNFHEYDKETHLHGHHLYKGTAGSWKELVPEEFHAFVNHHLGPHLNAWGYKVE